MKYTYSISNLTIDNGIIFEDSSSEGFLNLDDSVEDFASNKEELYENVYFQASFTMTNKNTIHYLEYIKIPDICANVGGIISLFLPVLEYILRIFIDSQFKLHLFYSFFKIKDTDCRMLDENLNFEGENAFKDNIHLDDNKDSPNNPDLMKEIKYGQLQNINDLKDEASQNPEAIQYLKKSQNANCTNRSSISELKEIKMINKMDNNESQNKIEINYFTMLSYDYCCGNRKVESNKSFKLIEMVDELLNQKNDILHITKILDQSKLLAKIILNENQYLMLNNMDLELIKENSEDKLISKEDINKNISDYILDLKEKGTIGKEDRLLISHLPDDLQEQFIRKN